MPYFSFVMVCYNNWGFTKNALESFFESLNLEFKEKGFEFILINNGSRDETADAIEEYKQKYKGAADIETVHLEENLGYINGINIAISRCRGEIITILNNDLIFCPGWFDGLVEQLEMDQRVGIAAPFITNGSGRENIILSFATPELEQAFYKSKDTMNFYAREIMKKNSDQILYETRIVGACMAIRRKVLDSIGGLDYWLGIGIFDDDDYTLRTNIAGYKTVIVGSSFIYHVGNASFSKVRSVSNAAVLSNKYKFVHKWKLRCKENLQGLYSSREEVILNTPYKREEHFVPVSIQQYCTSMDFSINKVCGTKNIFMAADWTNFKSRWLQKLEAYIYQIDENDEIYLWMPSTHFSKEVIEVKGREISKLLKPETDEDHRSIKIIDKGFGAVNLPSFLKSFDTVLTVEDDFVNRYIVYLAKQMGLDIQ